MNLASEQSVYLSVEPLTITFCISFKWIFGPRPVLKDAQFGYVFSDNFQLVAGTYKPYLSIDLDPNPGATDFINRARYVGVMLNTREIGLTVLGEARNLNYRFGLYNGTGLSRSNDGKFLYTGTLGAHLSEKSDLLGRWGHLEYEILDSELELLTFGVNYQTTKLVIFQVNLLVLLAESHDAKLGTSVNFQFQF